MVRPTQELSTLALTDAQTIAIGDGVDTGDEGVDLDGGGTNPGTVTTPPDTEVLEVVDDAGDAVEIDFETSNWWDITLTADCEITISNPPATGIGQLHIIFRQGTGAPWTVTWPAEVQWPAAGSVTGGPAPNLHTDEGARDFVEILTEDGGLSYGGYLATGPTLVETVTASGAALDLDYGSSTWWDVTLSANCALSIVNPPPIGWVGELHVILRQGTGAPWTVTWPAAVVWPDSDGLGTGTAPTLHVLEGAQNDIILTTFDGGVTWGGDDGLAGSGSSLTVKDEGSTLTSAASSLDFVGGGVVATVVGAAVTVTVNSSGISAMGFVGEILISDTPAGSPLVFADLIQNEAQDDLVYADPL